MKKAPLFHLFALLWLALGCISAAEGAGKDAAKPEAAPVRFLMFNVEDYFVAGEKQRSQYTITPKSEASREAVADIIADAEPDIVGLIEIGGEKALADLRKRLEARGLKLPHGKVVARQGEDRALALLSAHPISKDDSVADAPLYGEQRRKMLRGILDVTCKHKDGRKFRIVGAHLKSQVAKDPAAADSLRKREADTLALHIGDILKKQAKMPLLVFGDWNDEPDSDALAALRSVKGKDARNRLHRLKPCDALGESWTLFHRRGEAPCTFDQVYVNSVLHKRMGDNAACGIVDKKPPARASGHRALWCEVK